MGQFLGDRRRPFVTAVIISLFAILSGALAVLVEQEVLGLKGEALVLWTTVVISAGGVIGTVFGAPLFAASLEDFVTLQPPPPPDPSELERWFRPLRAEIVRRRDKQREQMLRGNSIMEQLVTPNLELRTGRSGKPLIRVGGNSQGRADLTQTWEESRGRLVVLGKPGYGKTFATLILIRKVNHEGKQVSDLFSLADWYVWSVGHKDATIEDWLISEISHAYPDFANVARPLVMEGRLVPVFDGLDEVPAQARIDCRNALEAYAGRESPHRPFVLTCREEEYLELSPKWVGADRQVALVGLSGEEIVSILRADTSLSSSWQEVIAAVEAGDQDLLSLLRSPLRLGAVLEVYETRDPIELLDLAKRRHAGEELWDLLLGTEAHVYQDHEQVEVRKWLSFIAASIKVHQRQRFWLHELYLYAAPSDRRWFFRLVLVLLVTPLTIQALLVGNVFACLFTGTLIAASYLFYRDRRDKPLQIPVKHRTRPLNYVKAIPGSIVFGLMLGLLWAAGVLPVIWVLYLLAQLIDGIPLDLLWAAKAALSLAAFWGISMVAIGIAVRLEEVGSSVVAEEPPNHLLGRGPGAVLRSALIHGLLAIGICGSLLVLAQFFVSHRFQVPVWVAFTTLIFAWMSGIEAWAYYHWTRWRLSRRKLLPLQLRAFLDWAAEDTGLLRASDSYEFRHRELLDYLAQGVYPVGATNVSWEESRRRPSPSRGSKAPAQRTEAKSPTRQQKEAADHRRRLAEATEALRLDGSDPKSHSALGNAHYHVGNPLGALEHLREATRLEPENARYLGDYARVLDTLGQSGEALQVLPEGAGPGPGSAHLHNLRAAIRKNQRAHETRVEIASEKTRAMPDDPLAWWGLSVAHLTASQGMEAAQARRRAVELADQLDPDTARRLGRRLNAGGYSKDAATVGRSLPARERIARAEILGPACSDLGAFEEAERCLQDLEQAALKPAVLSSLANLLIVRGRWADAAKAAEQAYKKDPGNLAFRFTWAEACFASGDLDLSRTTLGSALDEARRGETMPVGDPTWLCRILWHYNAFARPELAIEMLVEVFKGHGRIALLAEGLISATPTSAEQTGWNPERLSEWCSHWGRHPEMRAAVGAVQWLATTALNAVGTPA
jgi:tetratricopeptide (TPR) repeat protein